MWSHAVVRQFFVEISTWPKIIKFNVLNSDNQNGTLFSVILVPSE